MSASRVIPGRGGEAEEDQQPEEGGEEPLHRREGGLPVAAAISQQTSSSVPADHAAPVMRCMMESALVICIMS